MERDLRDPQAIGEALAQLRKQHPDEPTHKLVDYIDTDHVELHAPGSSSTTLGERAKYRYQHELRERALAGDKYAISLLNGGKPPGADEPE